MLDRGIEKSGLNLANAMRTYFHQVSILCWGIFGQKKRIINGGLNIKRLPLPKYYSSYFASIGYFIYLLIKKPDIVIIFFAGHGEAWPIRRAKKLIHFHLIFVAGYPIETVPHRYREFRVLGIEPLLDSIIVKSTSMKKGVEDYFHRRVQVINNGIDTDYYSRKIILDTERFKKVLGIKPGSVVLITVAALEKRKGMVYIIKALERLMQRDITDIHYIIVGDGDDRQYYEGIINSSPVSNQVELVGSVKDVRPYYAIADLFLLLSYGEGFPNVLLEAWAMELSVVVSTFPPFPEITNSSNAFNISVNDKAVLDELIEKVIQNKPRFRAIGIENRKKVREEYSWQNIASKYFDNFNQINKSGNT